jgi:hypothetical protein
MMQLLERGRGKNATVEQNSMEEQSEMEEIRRQLLHSRISTGAVTEARDDLNSAGHGKCGS